MQFFNIGSMSFTLVSSYLLYIFIFDTWKEPKNLRAFSPLEIACNIDKAKKASAVKQMWSVSTSFVVFQPFNRDSKTIHTELR